MEYFDVPSMVGRTMKPIVHIIVGLNDGGAEGVLARICLLEPEKHIVISLMDMGKYGPILEQGGVKVYCLNLNPSKMDLKKTIELYSLIRSIKPAIVQTWMYHADFLGGMVAKIAGVPKIFWGIRHSNLSKGTIKKSTYFIMKMCAILSYFIPKKIISCSRDAIESHKNQGYVKNKFELIQNGYDLNKFRPLLDQKIKFNYKKPVIAMVARYDVQKDHQNLLQALSILKSRGSYFHAVLVGTGMTEDNKELMELISLNNLKLHKDITLYGRCNDIPALMNAIDLHVLSSLGEAFPNVLAEAMACGIPCVSTDVGDAKEIIDKYGWIVPAQNSIKLADAISAALSELQFRPNEWQARKSDCVMHIQNNFEIQTMIQKYHRIWEN